MEIPLSLNLIQNSMAMVSHKTGPARNNTRNNRSR